jgi:hypothetical protein
MKKNILVTSFFLLVFILNSNAQRTFEKFLSITKIYGAEQNPDGSYILCFDSSGPGVMKLDNCGDRVWVNFPTVRNNAERIYDIAPDPIGGGYIAGGSSPDTSGVYTHEPFLMILDQNGFSTASRILPPGAIGGNVSSVHASNDSGFVAGVFLDQIGGTNSSVFARYDLSLADSWNAIGLGSQIYSNSVGLKNSNEYLFASYNQLTSTAPAVRQLDNMGMITNTFVVPDTFQGGVSFEMNAVVDHCPSGDNLVGATLLPTGGSYEYPYIAKLDAFLNVVWQKIFDFGTSVQVMSVLSTQDNGAMCMINRSDTIIFLRLDNNGDSLWSRTYSGIGTVKANFLRHCADGGFLLSGNTSNGIDNFGLVLKLDSMAMVLPSVCIQTSSSTIICPGTNVTLTADSGYQYLWSTSETTQSIVVDTVGTYYVTVTDTSSGLSARSEDIQVGFYATTTPTISLLGTLLVSSPAISYQWLFYGDTIVGATGSDISLSMQGNYSVIVEDSNGCILTSATYVYVFPGLNELDKVSAFELKRLSKDFVELDMHNSATGMIRLIDLRGLVVKEVNVLTAGDRSLRIPVSNLVTGIYSIVWSSENSVQVEKLFIGY